MQVVLHTLENILQFTVQVIYEKYAYISVPMAFHTRRKDAK